MLEEVLFWNGVWDGSFIWGLRRHPALAMGRKNRKRTVGVLLLILAFVPKLPNFSMAAMSQDSGPGILRRSNQDCALCFLGDDKYELLLRNRIPSRFLVLINYSLRSPFHDIFSCEQRVKTPFPRNCFLRKEHTLSVVFCCCLELSTLGVFCLSILSPLGLTETVVWHSSIYIPWVSFLRRKRAHRPK